MKISSINDVIFSKIRQTFGNNITEKVDSKEEVIVAIEPQSPDEQNEGEVLQRLDIMV